MTVYAVDHLDRDPIKNASWNIEIPDASASVANVWAQAAGTGRASANVSMSRIVERQHEPDCGGELEVGGVRVLGIADRPVSDPSVDLLELSGQGPQVRARHAVVGTV